MIWEKIDVDASKVKEISQRYSIDTLLSSILVRRGITDPTDISFFLEDDIRFLYNPFLFKDMEDVIDRLLYAREEGEKILVFGDKDVDGVTSLVILYETLISMSMDASWRVPMGEEGYGLSVESVEKAMVDDITLIITVDCGISAFEAIDKAGEYGIDVIILDHHNPREGQIPNATYIINPKTEGCCYPFKDLAACGVVSKVIWALGFSQIESLYKADFCFFNIEVIGDSYILQGLKVRNLIPRERLELNTSDTDFSLETLVTFLRGEAILLYNRERMTPLISKIFGTKIDISFIDIKKDLERILPGIRGLDLNELTLKSRIKKYSVNNFSQIDTLLSLFTTYVTLRYVESFQDFFNSLDLVALGTVADLMPLTGENRILVRKGLKAMEKTSREGLRSLLFNLNLLGKDIVSKDLSWGIAPVINSAGRLDKANVAVEFLLSKDTMNSNKLMLNIQNLNKERREISNNLWDLCYNLLYKSLDELNGKMTVVYHKSMVKGVTGLIASKAVSTFNVPSIILAKENNLLVGSIRSKGDLDINCLFEFLGDILLDFGGHNCAGGFRLNYSDLDIFNKRLTKLIGHKDIFISNYIRKGDSRIDATIPHSFLRPEIIKLFDNFEPFGEGNPALTLVTNDVKILEIDFLGKLEKKHIKLLFQIGDLKWPGIMWNGASRVGIDFTRENLVNIAYRVERNNYTGGSALQLNIVDIIK